MTTDPLHVYLDPGEIGLDGYPYAWHGKKPSSSALLDGFEWVPAIKDLVREQAGHRCIRCKHPFVVGKTPGEWSPCDEQCRHGGPQRYSNGSEWELYDGPDSVVSAHVEAQWRVLTVHHLNGIKHDCRWHNLVALCQRCHLVIQGKVYMERRWYREHTEWFQPYAAGFYASQYLELELSREETMDRLEELLALEARQLSLEPDLSS